MPPSPAGVTRLAGVAIDRRRFRNKRQQHKLDAAANHEYKQPQQLDCDPTVSTTFEGSTFDDSTVSSKSVSESGWVSFDDSSKQQPVPHPPPPALLTARSSNKTSFNFERSNCESATSSSPSATATTPKRVYFESSNESGVDDTTAALTPRRRSPYLRNYGNVGRRSPKSDLTVIVTTPTNVSSVEDAVATIEHVIEERDKNRADAAMFKRKMNAAIATSTAVTKDLEDQLSKQKKELELTKAQKQYAEYQLNANKVIDEDVISLKGTVNEISNKLKETSKELTRVNQLNKLLVTEKESIEVRHMTLKNEVTKAEEQQKYTKKWMKETSERMEQMKVEYQQKDVQHAQQVAQLFQTIKELQIEKQANVSQSTMTSQQISSLENQLSDALSTNHNLENELTQEIIFLQNELRNSGHHGKVTHDSIVIEGLKAELAAARHLKEESVSAVQNDFDILKKECDESITYYRNTIETLRSELHDTKTRADADCNYWMHNFQPRLLNVKEENRTLIQQLTEAKMEVDQLRNVESKLEILQQAKAQTESELKNTQLQLDTAIRNLNEMALDGSKMRNDLEGFLNALKKEKNQYQKEIDRMNKVSEEQQTRIRNLMIENERYDVDCKELRIKVSDSMQVKDELNMKLRTLKLENEQHERLCSELQQTVALLNKKLEQEKVSSERHIKEMLVIKDQYKTCSSARGSTDTKQLILSECMDRMVKLEAENSRLSTHIAQHSRATEQLRHTHQEMSQKMCQKNARYEHECNELQSLISSLEERLAHEKEESHQVRLEVVALRDQCQTLLLDKATHEALQQKLSESTAMIKQLETDRVKLSAQLAQKHETSVELSHARQTIEVLKSKERYLESRVDSLANQISKTVQDYEMKLCDFSSSSSCEHDD